MHPDLAEMAEEINPFTSENMFDLVTIIEDEDLKANGQYSERTLIEKYKEGMETIRKASPPLPEGIPGAKSDDTRSKHLSVKATKEAAIIKNVRLGAA